MYEYIDKIQKLLNVVKEQDKENITKATDLIVRANEKKNSIYVFGASHAGILAQELYYRAGGMITINPIFGKEVMLDRQPITFTSDMERLTGYGTQLGKTVDFKQNDVLILHSVSGRNPIIIDLAIYAKKRGVKIIALTNLNYSKSVISRHPSGKRLFELADIILDNHGDIGDAACDIPGAEQKVGPTSTVIGAAILDEIVVDASRKIVRDLHHDSPVFYSTNLDGGGQKNKKLAYEYKDMIHYEY